MRNKEMKETRGRPRLPANKRRTNMTFTLSPKARKKLNRLESYRSHFLSNLIEGLPDLFLKRENIHLDWSQFFS